LEMVAEDSFIDVLGAGFDAGIRYEERLEQHMIAVPIGPRTQRFAAAGTMRGRTSPERRSSCRSRADRYFTSIAKYET
jgi:hypothetical protein